MSFQPRANWGATGATLYYRIVATADGTEAVARTSTGVAEDGTTGAYTVTLDDAYRSAAYTIQWDDGTLPVAEENLGVYAIMRGTDNAYTGTPPTADAIGTDAAGKVLATPANKLVTNATGQVEASNMVSEPPSIDDLPTNQELDAAIANLAHVDAAQDLTALEVAAAAIQAKTDNLPDDPASEGTVLAAIAGGAAAGDTLINHLTKLDASGNIDASGTALGLATAGSTLALYLSTDTTFATAIRQTMAASDGTWALYAAAGTYTLVVTKDRHYDAAEGDSAITRTVIVP